MNSNTGIGPAEILIAIEILFILPLIIVPFWKIFTKAGFNGLSSLLMVVPIVNIIVLFYFAFAKWPALKDDSVRERRNSTC